MCYVVCIQGGDPLQVQGLVPSKVFGDYPSALAYAQTLFQQSYLDVEFSAKDLVFMVPMVAAAAVTA